MGDALTSDPRVVVRPVVPDASRLRAGRQAASSASWRSDFDVLALRVRRPRLAAAAARAVDTGTLDAARCPHALLPALRLRVPTGGTGAAAAPGQAAQLARCRRLDLAVAAALGASRLSPGPLARRGRHASDAGVRERRGRLTAPRRLHLALPADSRAAACALE